MLRLGSLAVALAADANVAQAASLRLQPHVAIYDVNLKSAEDRTGLVKVSGRLALELLGSDCEDWTINFRMVSRFFTDESAVKLLDTQNSTWEAADGKTDQRHPAPLRRRQLDNESRVSATIGKGGSYGRIEMSDKQEAELATARFFPSVTRRRSSAPRLPARDATKAPFSTAPREPRPIRRFPSWAPGGSPDGR